nr:MAG TPA: hypothetical protein [Caudoviricetes sp.]
MCCDGTSQCNNKPIKFLNYDKVQISKSLGKK